MRAQQPARRTPDSDTPARADRPARGRAPAPLAGAARSGRPPGSLRALQRTMGNKAVARLVEDELRPRADVGDGGPAVQRSSVHQVLRSSGRPLDASTRAEMESRLGADFSDVRLHTGSAARESAARIGARAYTSGNHVVLGEGGGDHHTLAHELTHVIQQRKGPVAGTDNGDGLRLSDPSDRYEREAEANATRAMAAPLDTGAAPSGPGTTAQRATDGAAVQRMPKRTKDDAGIKGDSPPPRRATRSSTKEYDLDKPVLEFESSYDGPASQRLHTEQSIGFQQVARLRNPAGAPLAVATNYHFWQEVTDSNVQIVEEDGLDNDQASSRGWAQDGPYHPPYNNPVITNSQNSIEFNDNPGFSTSERLSSGYWLKRYSISFRWKVARNNGAWNRNVPCWTSPVVTHTLSSTLDPEHPDEPVPITANAAGDRTWTVDLSGLGTQ
ncbi:eCIS core domain-containing protein [Streptantibioticus cattleyicolor]|uniref:eCIS core domain-containing protein n=1 Tax=Streptantibioticus cattleyicolor (strain ATCC 35852 / DSM 46488 / JCM 4925 / NBRC 14057 / NRRL 8057) TaxID=1003195 RepID=F8JLE2_STREN|nr:DUF4157 domain-containing protein [Streptantibioticus cattleyicolor]AEW99563.1 hypothetical protein SCATT_p13700 [Streptantibioticus cattleyicolor NRRL 8057 = DSM 46488]CCB71398.1 conserved protein of unknown function [Streptantibioticus cattleyicolor NRRL 8057 = DSM 46488]